MGGLLVLVMGLSCRPWRCMLAFRESMRSPLRGALRSHHVLKRGWEGTVLYVYVLSFLTFASKAKSWFPKQI